MKPKVKKLSDKCDRLFRECLLIRDGSRCQMTGWYKPAELLEVSHYVGRTNKRVKWDPDNACLLDKFLHSKIPEFELRKWYREKFPDRAARVDAAKNEMFKVDEGSLKIVCETLRMWKLEIQKQKTEGNVEAV
jgi:hypothetical protein